MSLFWFLVAAALFLIVSIPLRRERKLVPSFDPGRPPAHPARNPQRESHTSQNGIPLGSGVCWAPLGYPNPHVLIVGGSGSGKSWTIRWLAKNLQELGFHCIVTDFHGDLAIEGALSHPIALNSQFGVNPLAVFLDPNAGGPAPQRFEVLDQLSNAFKPMGALQLALLDDCLKETYRKFGLHQDQPASWQQESTPHLGDLQKELESRIERNPKDLRTRGLRAKLSLAFDYQIFSKPQVPYLLPTGQSGPAQVLHLDLSKLPSALQYLAADTLLKQIFRQHQLAGTSPTSTYLLIDESKLCSPSQKESPLAAINRIATEGRKFGLGLIVATQSLGHLSRDVLINTFTKIVMRTDRTEVLSTARKFRLEVSALEALKQPGEALVHFADSNHWKEVRMGDSSL